jgi:hypothetical protein
MLSRVFMIGLFAAAIAPAQFITGDSRYPAGGLVNRELYNFIDAVGRPVRPMLQRPTQSFWPATPSFPKWWTAAAGKRLYVWST